MKKCFFFKKKKIKQTDTYVLVVLSKIRIDGFRENKKRTMYGESPRNLCVEEVLEYVEIK